MSDRELDAAVKNISVDKVGSPSGYIEVSIYSEDSIGVNMSAEELEGIELAEAVAIKIMGWTALREPGKAHIWVESGHFISGWRPDRDIAAAYQVEDRIEELGLIEEYCYQVHRVTLASWNLRRDGITHAAIWRLIHASPEDRCRAAVLAAEAE